jgi:hypothetical protein
VGNGKRLEKEEAGFRGRGVRGLRVAKGVGKEEEGGELELLFR